MISVIVESSILSSQTFFIRNKGISKVALRACKVCDIFP